MEANTLKDLTAKFGEILMEFAQFSFEQQQKLFHDTDSYLLDRYMDAREIDNIPEKVQEKLNATNAMQILSHLIDE